jgi:hypothetical protein
MENYRGLWSLSYQLSNDLQPQPRYKCYGAIKYYASLWSNHILIMVLLMARATNGGLGSAQQLAEPEPPQAEPKPQLLG